MPSPSASIDLPAIQSLLRPDEILVVFKLDRPSSRWLVGHEHAMFDRIADVDAIADASPSELGELLFGGISTAEGRPMMVVGPPELHAPFAVVRTEREPITRRHSVTWYQSIEEFVAFRQREPARIATGLRRLAFTLVAASLAVVFGRLSKAAPFPRSRPQRH